jgi:hypothetical protein
MKVPEKLNRGRQKAEKREGAGGRVSLLKRDIGSQGRKSAEGPQDAVRISDLSVKVPGFVVKSLFRGVELTAQRWVHLTWCIQT